MDEMESNIESFTSEAVAEWLLLKYGDQASIQAALQADHCFAHNDLVTANLWHAAMKLTDLRPREIPGTVH
jgi:hypothetical protein